MGTPAATAEVEGSAAGTDNSADLLPDKADSSFSMCTASASVCCNSDAPALVPVVPEAAELLLPEVVVPDATALLLPSRLPSL